MIPLSWATEKRKINSLIPWVNNPRVMKAEEVEKLKKSLRDFNLVEIPVINSNGRILAGHQRLRVMQLLGRGEEEIDVRVPNRELTEEEAQKYAIISNKVRGDWDDDLLASMDSNLLLESGFSEAELEKIFDVGLSVEAEVPFTQELSEANNYVVLAFNNEVDWLQIQTLLGLVTVKALDSKPGFEKSGIGRVINGAEAIQKIQQGLRENV